MTDPRVAPAFELRPVRAEELGQVIAIERAAHAHPWSDALVAQELANAWSTVLCAIEPAGERAGRIAGFVVFWSVHDEIQVLDVAVAPVDQRRGIARRLLVEVERRARERSCVLMTLEVRRTNAPARGLYRSQGFQEVGLRKRYYDDGEDAFVMVKDLAAT